MRPLLNNIQTFVENVLADGYGDVVLLGMGGSSLAPEVFSRTFGTQTGFLRLHVADTTDPGALLAIQRHIKPDTTLFIVATKSGGTVETLSGFKYY
jgi:glucose-6-phosphate isomerase